MLLTDEEMQIDLAPHPANAPVVDPIARISAERASEGKKSLELAATSSGKPLPDLGAALPDPNADGEGGGRGRKRPQGIGPYQGFFYSIDASRRRPTVPAGYMPVAAPPMQQQPPPPQQLPPSMPPSQPGGPYPPPP